MARTSILTDSTSGLDPEEVRPLGIAMIPIHIEIGGRTYREGVDLSAGELIQLLASDSAVPRTAPPTIREFHDVFRALARESEEIIALHVSSRLSRTVSLARQAAQTFIGGGRITVVDSRLVATPLAWLARAAAEAATAGVDTMEIVRLIRAMTSHMYLAFFSESMEYLREEGLLRRAPAVATAGGATRPLLLIEEGEIMPLERSRSRGRLVDRLFEFVTEFARVERLAILQGKPLPEAIELATLVNEKMPELPVETATYPASVAAQVGLEALGVAVYEGVG